MVKITPDSGVGGDAVTGFWFLRLPSWPRLALWTVLALGVLLMFASIVRCANRTRRIASESKKRLS